MIIVSWPPQIRLTHIENNNESIVTYVFHVNIWVLVYFPQVNITIGHLDILIGRKARYLTFYLPR